MFASCFFLLGIMIINKRALFASLIAASSTIGYGNARIPTDDESSLEQLTRELKEEIKKDIRHELKEEIKREVRRELKEEARQEFEQHGRKLGAIQDIQDDIEGLTNEVAGLSGDVADIQQCVGFNSTLATCSMGAIGDLVNETLVLGGEGLTVRTMGDFRVRANMGTATISARGAVSLVSDNADVEANCQMMGANAICGMASPSRAPGRMPPRRHGK